MALVEKYDKYAPVTRGGTWREFLKKRLTKFIESQGTANWHRLYHPNLLQAYFHQDDENEFRVSIWAEDNFGMEKTFNNEEEARDCYNNLPSPISLDWLKTNGFKVA